MAIDTTSFLEKYFADYTKFAFPEKIYPTIEAFAQLAFRVRESGNKMMFAGNGASASISEHGAVDFTKQGQVRVVTVHDPNLITCFANDFGYDYWMSKAVEHYADDGDVVVLTSTSGKSPSVVNAAKYAKERGLTVVTFTGQSEDNPLKQLGDINFHVPSMAYNLVENTHSIWLTATVDLVIGKAVYTTRALVEQRLDSIVSVSSV